MSSFARPPGSPEALATAASRFRTVARTLESAALGLGAQVARTQSAWSGRRSLDFLAVGCGLRDLLGDGAGDLAAVAAAVSDLGEHLERAVAEMSALATRAQSPELDPGTLHQLEQHAEEVRRDYRTAAHRVAARVTGLTDHARAFERDLASAGESAVSEWPGLERWLDAEALPLPDHLGSATPAQVARWWERLRPAQRIAALRHHPAALGNLDGLPGWARDLANRVQLPRLRAYLRHELAHPSALEALLDEVAVGGLDRATTLRGSLRALDEIEAVLARGGQHLLTLDAGSGRFLHAAVAIGDVDTADNVAVFVPGFTTRVESSLSGYDRDLSVLRERAVRASYRFAKGGTPRTSAFVAWLGYDAPQAGPEVVAGPFSVASPHLADVGGDALAGFLTGIGASRRDDPHLVALGHSYGSTTTGYALRHRGTGVDDAVFFGSPGLGALRASSLKVPRGHLFALEAEGDPVADLPRFGLNPDHLAGVTLLSADADLGGGTGGSTGHSEYLADRSTSQHNIALVSIGHARDATRDERQPAALLDMFGR